jgi:ATP-independent RNA helicase DbpA
MRPTEPPAAFLPLGLPPALLRAVGELGFVVPTPVQSAALPPGLAGRDVVARSRTGSGKTVAFALPLLARVDITLRRPQAIVLCPTRELGAQVAASIRALGRHLPGLRVLLVAGGQPGGPQRRALEEGVHVIVGTPGRAKDHLERDAIETRYVRVVVLDEADRMLDMGFRDDVEHILSALPVARQTLLFSATWLDSTAEMSTAWQRDPAHVVVTEEAESPRALREVACLVDDKVAALVELCGAHPGPTIVFCNMKTTAADCAHALSRAGVAADYIGGDLEQHDRDRVLAQLRNQSLRVLVATDVAARGLDVDDLALVVNFDLPPKPEVYVHRIGRTGRAGRSGLAVSLVNAREADRVARHDGDTPIERVALATLIPADRRPAPAPMVTLFIGGGRKDKLRPGDILGALTGDAQLTAADVGKIEIQERFAYVAVARNVADAAVQRLGGRIKGRSFRIERVR